LQAQHRISGADDKELAQDAQARMKVRAQVHDSARFSALSTLPVDNFVQNLPKDALTA
jgi:hypothetical protein